MAGTVNGIWRALRLNKATGDSKKIKKSHRMRSREELESAPACYPAILKWPPPVSKMSNRLQGCYDTFQI